LKYLLTRQGIEFSAEFDLVNEAPEASFEPSEKPSATDEHLIATATTYPTLQRVLKARRQSDRKTIYVVELAAGEDASLPQAALHWGLGEG
jgi:hypothetical protein